jgi:hypothetical protein
MNSESLLNAIFSSDVEAASEALNGALASKVANALEVKKVEIASNLISAPTEVATETVDATE